MTNTQIASEVHTALFNLQFMCMMLNCGRTEEADKAVQNAHEALTVLQKAYPLPEKETK